MLSHLKPLPDVLLQNLGRASRQDYLAQTLESEPLSRLKLHQHRDGGLYAVRFSQDGLDLMMQCVNPEAEETKSEWGLHSFTLHAPDSEPIHHWKGEWLRGIDPLRATRRDVDGLLASHGDAVLGNPGITCFTVSGLGGQRWSLLFRFDAASSALQTMSVVRTGEWIPASVLPPWPKTRSLDLVQAEFAPRFID